VKPYVSYLNANEVYGCCKHGEASVTFVILNLVRVYLIRIVKRRKVVTIIKNRLRRVILRTLQALYSGVHLVHQPLVPITYKPGFKDGLSPLMGCAWLRPL
jgi:isoleucyl-tRNA synthetase